MKPLTFKEEPYAGESPPDHTSKWLPEPDLIAHQAIGKLGEEAAELAKICARILIQGLDGVNPDDGKDNRKALAEEITDVTVMIRIVDIWTRIRVDPARHRRKYSLKNDWLEQLVEKT